MLFLLIFLWTPPHFWALALFVRSDYAAAGIPMMPVVAGEQSTRRQILFYALIMAAAIRAWPLSYTARFMAGRRSSCPALLCAVGAGGHAPHRLAI